MCDQNGKMKGFNLKQWHLLLLQQNTICLVQVVILQPALTRPLIIVACPISHPKLQVVSNMHWEPKDTRIRAAVSLAQWLLLCSIWGLLHYRETDLPQHVDIHSGFKQQISQSNQWSITVFIILTEWSFSYCSCGFTDRRRVKNEKQWQENKADQRPESKCCLMLIMRP